MAVAHLYVRVQMIEASNADVEAIERAAADLQRAVEAAGGEWRGSVHVTLDDPPQAKPSTPHEGA